MTVATLTPPVRKRNDPAYRPDRGYLPAPSNKVVRSRNLRPLAKLTLLALWSHGDADGWCWVSVPTLAEEIVADVKTVRAALADLVRAGLVSSVPCPGNSLYYHIAPAEIAAILEETPTIIGRGKAARSECEGAAPLPDLVAPEAVPLPVLGVPALPLLVGVPLPIMVDEGVPLKENPLKGYEDDPSSPDRLVGGRDERSSSAPLPASKQAAGGGDVSLPSLPTKNKPDLTYQTALPLPDGIPSLAFAAAQALCDRIGALTGQPDTNPNDVIWIARKYGPLIDLDEAAMNMAALIENDFVPSKTAKMIRIGALLAKEVGFQRERHGMSAAPEPARPTLAAVVAAPSETHSIAPHASPSRSDASAPPVVAPAPPLPQPEPAPSMSAGANLWGQIAGHLRAKISAAQWQTWFEDSTAAALTDDELTVALPGALAPQHVAAKWGPVVDAVASLVALHPVRVRWVCAEGGGAAASWAS